jgi:acetylornithine/succinyldiaminopimelate/putrescine aminotransferase
MVEPENNRFEVITFNGSFHGRTLAGISATGQEKVKKGFEPMTPGFVQIPFNDAPALLAAMKPHTAAVLVEPVQGESGIHPATAHFLKTARSICDDHGVLLMFDEIQCGMGRTGTWAGWRSIAPDVVPDAVSWAKGIAGGFPLGAFWVRDKKISLKSGSEGSLADLLGPGSHGTTFGGTPLVCTGALEVLDIIEGEGLLENAKTMGAYAKSALEGIGSPLIKEIRGIGLMLGIEFVPDFAERVQTNDRAPSLFLCDRLHEAGMLNVPSGTHALRWLPPLNVTRAEVDEAVEILRRTLTSAA